MKNCNGIALENLYEIENEKVKVKSSLFIVPVTCITTPHLFPRLDFSLLYKGFRLVTWTVRPRGRRDASA